MRPPDLSSPGTPPEPTRDCPLCGGEMIQYEDGPDDTLECAWCSDAASPAGRAPARAGTTEPCDVPGCEGACGTAALSACCGAPLDNDTFGQRCAKCGTLYRPRAHDSGTYGELPAGVRAMTLIVSHEWDNMTRDEQRTWLIAELERAYFQQRFGTPFDPTGAKTGSEIFSLRATVASLRAEVSRLSARPAAEEPESLAQAFHEAYEWLAPSFGYATREASAKPWADVPENNRRLMTAVCAEILARLSARPAEGTDG